MSEFQNDLSPVAAPPSSTASLPAKALSLTSTDQIGRLLDASNDAREIVRLVQCSQCSFPLEDPLTLPCGNSLCKKCLPELHERRNISYPATESRLQGFTCPFSECRRDHAQGDCCVDVTLKKILEVVKADIKEFRPAVSETPMRLDERDKWAISGVASLSGREARCRVLHGGRLVSTYVMAQMGELGFDSEVVYTTLSETMDEYRYLDVAVLERLKEATRSELDCQVCYALFLDPLTTNCGHTFCRKCLQRVLDHTSCCPICRHKLSVPPSLTKARYPSNKRLVALLSGLCPDAVMAREMTLRQEEKDNMGELNTPLFICTLSFPTMPTFLHIFEPRYRLMIRRVVESRDRNFGMILHNQRQIPQGDFGAVPFFQYGTLLHIVSVQLLADGRSLIETIGVSRFRVVKHGNVDGYCIGQIERIEDISLADEEALEASEISQANAPRALSADEHFGASPHQHSISSYRTDIPNVDSISTKDLMATSMQFVRTMQAQSAPWLRTRILQIYGDCPDDPASFPWWFASVFPIAESEKYELLATTSVRQRLKICVRWILRIEAQRR
jgi:ATP-dependent protease La (LON) substrate-binding domain/Zinc finger, C3HC4 type (RING finger)